MRRGSLFLIGAVLLTTGCTANDEHLLYREVGRLIRPGIPMKEAEKALSGAGFTCTRAISAIDPPNLRDCSRLRSYAVMATCVQTVDLTPDRSATILESYYVPRIPCAGL